MKQVVVINKDLKMSKGKIARVCLHLGYLSSGNAPKEWGEEGFKGVILKASSDEYDELKFRVYEAEVTKVVEHVDAGRTQVESGSCCGFCFFCKEDEFDFINELKLL